jgi:hypothetical protein
MEQLGSSRSDFCDILYLTIFRQYVTKIQVSLKSDKHNVRALHMKTNIAFVIISPSVLLRMMFQTKVVQKIKIHILCSKTFFRKP